MATTADAAGAADAADAANAAGAAGAAGVGVAVGAAVPTAATARDAAKAHAFLATLLGVNTFKPGQIECLRAIIDGKDVLAHIPCNGGKTLIFESAVITHCDDTGGAIGLLAVPLKSIMSQVKHRLCAKGIEVVELTNKTSDKVCTLLRAGRPRGPIVIVFRPENIVNNKDVLAALAPPSAALGVPFDFRVKEYKLHRSPVVVFGIDEAHCGVLWGGTFIQEWGCLGFVTKALSQWTCGRPPVLLMTATAPPAARSFLKSAFLLRKPPSPHAPATPDVRLHEELHAPRRGNVKLHFHPSQGLNGTTHGATRMNILKSSILAGNVVLVFCDTKAACRTACDSIQTSFDKWFSPGMSPLRVETYHGDVPTRLQVELLHQFELAAQRSRDVRDALDRLPDTSSLKRRLQSWGNRDIIVVLVATIALGMGVDLKNINHVLMWRQPRCITDLIQQTLRGGRDGNNCRVDIFLAWNVMLTHLADARALQAGDTRVGPRLSTEAGQDEANVRKQVLARAGITAEKELLALMSLGHDRSQCRWKQIDKHFGFAGTPPCQSACDVCQPLGVPVPEGALDVDTSIKSVFEHHAEPGSGWDLSGAIERVSRKHNVRTILFKQRVSLRLRQLYRTGRIKLFRHDSVWKFYGCTL
jgi:superfamily II DNA helicase RecQ